MFKVYKLAKENRETIDTLLADDVLGRQTITYLSKKEAHAILGIVLLVL